MADEKYIRSLLSEVGVCNSIKAVSDDKFNILFELCKRHPDFADKLNDMVDFKIIRNKLNTKAYELNIVKVDSSVVDILWKVCITGKPKTFKHDLYAEFRTSVDDQIADF